MNAPSIGRKYDTQKHFPLISFHSYIKNAVKIVKWSRLVMFRHKKYFNFKIRLWFGVKSVHLLRYFTCGWARDAECDQVLLVP